MNDLEFRQQVLDPLSASFCAAKWYNATIWLGSGQTTSCHHPPAHLIDPIEALHEARNTPYTEDVNLRTLEIAFDRTCQFACSYCNPAFSSTWVKDIRRNGAYQNLVSDGRNHFTHDHANAQLWDYGEHNPYIDAFFKWWESDLHRTLQELRITGGEPLMSGHTWKLIDWFRTNSGKSSTRLAINSNLGTDVDIDRLLDATQNMAIDIYTSNEAVGVQAEYIRDGLVWADWMNNVNRLLSSKQFRSIHVMCTINALCLDSLDQLLECIVKWKLEYGRDAISFTLNILRFPSFQSPLILPAELKTHYKTVLETWLTNHSHSEYLHEHEINHLQRLIDYLDVVKTPHSDTFEMPKLLNDFKQFHTQYDQRRNKDFGTAFPNLQAWYNSL